VVSGDAAPLIIPDVNTFPLRFCFQPPSTVSPFLILQCDRIVVCVQKAEAEEERQKQKSEDFDDMLAEFRAADLKTTSSSVSSMATTSSATSVGADEGSASTLLNSATKATGRIVPKATGRIVGTDSSGSCNHRRL
jgi:hypothetical protein